MKEFHIYIYMMSLDDKGGMWQKMSLFIWLKKFNGPLSSIKLPFENNLIFIELTIDKRGNGQSNL